MKKIFCLLALGLLLIFAQAALALEVTDVKNDHWAAAAIANALNKGFMGFKSDYSFAPDDTLQRAEFIHSL